MKKVYEMLYELRPENDFMNSNNFIAEALLDSLDILELVSLIEEEYNVQIEPKDIIPENFSNADDIITLINRYKNNIE